jgi:hypothetical protein
MTWSVAALACFGQEAGNGTEKVGLGMVETGIVESLCSKDNGVRAWTPATR